VNNNKFFLLPLFFLIFILTILYSGCASSNKITGPTVIKYKDFSLESSILITECADLRGKLERLDQNDFNTNNFTKKLHEKLNRAGFQNIVSSKTTSLLNNKATAENIKNYLATIEERNDINWIIMPIIVYYKEDNYKAGEIRVLLYNRESNEIYHDKNYVLKYNSSVLSLHISMHNSFINKLSEAIRDDLLKFAH